MTSSAKAYDLVLFGVTGFTGKLAVEHVLTRGYFPGRWAVCARNEAKARAVLAAVAEHTGVPAEALPAVEVADLVCTAPEDEEVLRAIVRKAEVVITTAGPFEKYGQALLKLCAAEGVSYADITGETDFVRAMITQCDAEARRTGAVIVPHCGNDCIPWDLTVWEMHKRAQARGWALTQVSFFTEAPPSLAASGGTLTTAIYQLGKERRGAKTAFDPLLLDAHGVKAPFATKNASPKRDVYLPEFKRSGGPWIMGPVMANCVRRSNALLGYSPSLVFSDVLLRDASWWTRVQDTAFNALVGAAIAMPFLFQRFLPAPGEGPSREAMEAGYLVLHARGEMAAPGGAGTAALASKFTFPEDTGYLCTARMLVESGRLLLERKRMEAADGGGSGGVTTPAAAFGSVIVDRLVDTVGATFDLRADDEAEQPAGGGAA